MDDDTVKPCAIKKLAYTTSLEVYKANAELEALEAALGRPNLVQCLGACAHMDDALQEAVYIITE